MQLAARNGLQVTGMVSSEERAATVKAAGAHATVNRRDQRFADIFTRVPSDPDRWNAWERAGEARERGRLKPGDAFRHPEFPKVRPRGTT